ncbi:hypothetical protein [Parapedobacter koreensis]|uniref:Uncharacterized protein n=1 Tax=Parapedobacter koreensis TaxID=332977 RepID=A0A1H7STP8_9SPHI|nr:hypothetical protein [Parapedobacter koreensis]SEL75699.1 hypothetical protein SAMN05421740_109179 [Parapedobacter koreensis]
MKNLLFFAFFFPSIAFSQPNQVLEQAYSFIISDGEVAKISQRNDTLYQWHGNIIAIDPELLIAIDDEPKNRYRIIATTDADNLTLLKLEHLDSIPLTTDPFPANRFLILAIKHISDDKIGYLPIQGNLTKEELGHYEFPIESLGDKFFLTYFSEPYWHGLAKQRKITTKEEAQQVLDYLNSEEVKKLVQIYRETDVPDMYGSGLFAELINIACIKFGFSPIGANKVLQEFIQ